MKATKTFIVTVEIQVSDAALDESQTPEWQAQMYSMTREAVFNMIAYNVARNHVTKLTEIDGFADRKPEELQVNYIDWDED